MTQVNMKDENYHNLQSIVNTPQIKMTTLGVILDATGTYKTDDSFDYVCKIRIIDDTYNPINTKKNKKTNQIQPYIYVFIFSQKIAQSPKITCIGDIVFLKDFSFDTYKDTLVRGTLKKYSKWGLIDGFNQDMDFKQQSEHLELSSGHKQRIKDLRKWIRSYYAENSLHKMIWYQYSDYSEHFNKQDMIYQSKDIDIIVKVVDFAKSMAYKNTYTKIVFVDENLREYFSEIKNLKVNLERDMIVKLRSVQIQAVKNTYAIEFFNYSEILMVQKFFIDAQSLLDKTDGFQSFKQNLDSEMKNEFHLEKFQAEKINQYTTIYRTSDQKLGYKLLKEFEHNFEILKEFDMSKPQSMQSISQQFGSLIMKKHADLPLTTLSELQKILSDHNSKKKQAKTFDNQAFRICVKLDDVKFTTLQDNIKFFNLKTNTENTIQEIRDNGVLEPENFAILLQNTFEVSDSSVKNDKESVYIFLQTVDNNPNFIYDLWQILPPLKVEEFQDQQKFENLQVQFEETLESLMNKTNSKRQYEFVVELYRNWKNETFLRIIDSIFWFVSKQFSLINPSILMNSVSYQMSLKNSCFSQRDFIC